MNGAGAPELRLVVAGRGDALEPARLRVVEHLAPHRLPPAVLNAVELVLEETLMNAAMHAFPDGADHRVDVAVRVEPEDIVLEFGDDGVAFDPRRHEPEPPPPDLAHAPIGGLGLKLVRAHARRIDYRREGQRNALTIAIARR